MKKIFTLFSIVALFATQVLSQCTANSYAQLQSCFSQTGTVNITLTANISLTSDLVMSSGTTYNVTLGSFDIIRNGQSYVGGDASTKIVVGSANVRNDNTGLYTMNGLNASNSLRSYVIILKVEMLYFNGQSVKGGVQLNWATASETNSSHFLLERSIDARSWQLLSTIKTNNKPSNYSYDDVGNISAYYRLGEVGTDGKTEIFKAIFVEKKDSKLTIFPNPTTAAVTIVSAQPILIYDLTGKLYRSELGGNAVISNLPKGVYLVRAGAEAQRVIVQ